MNTASNMLISCKDVAYPLFDKIKDMNKPEYKVVGVYYEEFYLVNGRHIAVLVVGDINSVANDVDSFLKAHYTQVKVDVKCMPVEGDCDSAIVPKLYAVRGLPKQLIGIDYFNGAAITDGKLAFANCTEVSTSRTDDVNEPHESSNGLDAVVIPPLRSITSFNPGRYSINMVEATNRVCRLMYQHYINVKPNECGNVVNNLQAAFLKYKNMHSLPLYGDLSLEFQDQLSMYGITPIQVENGIIRWKKDVLDTGITFADKYNRITGGGINTNYVLSVMHLHIDDHDLVVCISKRYMCENTTPLYLLNVVELLDDTTAMPYDGDVVQYISNYLATA